jgi:hypothetical protein
MSMLLNGFVERDVESPANVVWVCAPEFEHGIDAHRAQPFADAPTDAPHLTHLTTGHPLVQLGLVQHGRPPPESTRSFWLGEWRT